MQIISITLNWIPKKVGNGFFFFLRISCFLFTLHNLVRMLPRNVRGARFFPSSILSFSQDAFRERGDCNTQAPGPL